MKRAILTMALGATLGIAAQAAPLNSLSEGFNDISTLAGTGWVQTNNSAPAGATAWFQGDSGIFAAASGPADSYIGANFLNAAFPAGGAISNWLLTPTMSLSNGEMVNFSLRLLGEGFLDTVEVYVSGNGASSNVGLTTTSTGDFSLLASFSSDVDTGWLDHAVAISGLGGPNTAGRVAFRYTARDNLTQADYIGIDGVSIPEPSTTALFGIALLGVVLNRRRKAVAKG